jgi:hypothetical protein
VVDRHLAAGEIGQRFAPHVEHGVGSHQRIAQRGRLLDVQLLGRLAVLRVGEIQVARHAQQLPGRDGGAGAAAAGRDVGLQRSEVAPAVEDDRNRLGEREPRDPQRDRYRGGLVEQRPAKQIFACGVIPGVILVEHGRSF